MGLGSAGRTGRMSSGSLVVKRQVTRPAARGRLPIVLALIGVLLLTGAILAVAPAAHADLPPAPTYTTIAGMANNWGSADGTGSAARFYEPLAMAVDPDGNVFITDIWNSTIRRMTPDGVVTTVAGTALRSWADGTGAGAAFYCPAAICYSKHDDCFYIADTYNQCVRKMTRDYAVTTIAGLHGSQGIQDGTGTGARFRQPWGIACAPDGTIYVADTDNHTIRKVTPAGVVTTLAGSAGAIGSQDGTGSNARFDSPTGVAVDAAGTVYVGDRDNHTIRAITPAGVVTTLAGSAGISGSDDGLGSAARFFMPWGIGCDPAGNVFVADCRNSTIRRITPSGMTTTVGGTAGVPGSIDGVGTAARFYSPYTVAFHSDGTGYVGDANWVVRKVTGAAEQIGRASCRERV